jgi:hypothetical protein
MAKTDKDPKKQKDGVQPSYPKSKQKATASKPAVKPTASSPAKAKAQKEVKDLQLKALQDKAKAANSKFQSSKMRSPDFEGSIGPTRQYTKEENERIKDIALRKFNKSFKPASGRLDPTLDEPFWRIATNPPGGFGVRKSGASGPSLVKNPPAPRGGNSPDYGGGEDGVFYAKKAKRQEPLDKEFVRKSTTKKVLTRPTKKVLTKMKSKKSTKK